jgi:hypothetical protein
VILRLYNEGDTPDWRRILILVSNRIQKIVKSNSRVVQRLTNSAVNNWFLVDCSRLNKSLGLTDNLLAIAGGPPSHPSLVVALYNKRSWSRKWLNISVLCS